MWPFRGQRTKQLSLHHDALQQLVTVSQQLQKDVAQLRSEVADAQTLLAKLQRDVGLVRETADGTHEQFIAFRARVTGRWRRGNDPEREEQLPLDDPRVPREEVKRRLMAQGKLTPR